MTTVPQTGPFSDFGTLKLQLPSLKCEELKTILREINRQIPGGYNRLSGRKDDLVVRIEDQLIDAIQTQAVNRYEIIKRLILPKSYHSTSITSTTPRPNPITTQSRSNPPSRPHTSSSNTPGPSNNTMNGSNPLRANAPTTDFGPASLSRLVQYDAHRPKPQTQTQPTPIIKRPAPLHPPAYHNQLNAHRTFLQQQQQQQQPQHSMGLPLPFESSPFYKFDSAASAIVTCPKAGPNDRKSVTLAVTLLPEQKNKLQQSKYNPTGPQYTLRLFSTSEKHFNHPAFATRGSSVFPPAPIEFPVSCELRLNSVVINSNIKGIKKQPGTAPPPDLMLVDNGNCVNLGHGESNRLEIIYSNSDKRFYFIVYLVEHFSIPFLLKRLKSGKQRTKEEVLEKIKAGTGDDDVFTSSSVIQLLDPLVLTRIRTPIRSLQCTHLQCFDAETFYTMMDQAPTWSCPVCNMKLNPNELAIDGFTLDILQITPTSLSSVIVESDGTWHDENYEFGTSIKPTTTNNNKNETIIKQSNKRNIMVLDLDDDHNNQESSLIKNKNKQSDLIIDLTLDDD
ncbi:hypothetical protein CROQUDRAFT_62714 [Cronartium quercuum f. sp. fusiforme G11]|uniref:Uncharacterized protein n=1 Tax=Cronartium quercuum f. sp. fusiforme G11 TaxID=708437 RepID=A0A9P6NIG5_9BASI|nr:hypothetical protein CROQUDRAFT_62714 [Cronartium quercuum f. sp. fusiforme G11]